MKKNEVESGGFSSSEDFFGYSVFCIVFDWEVDIAGGVEDVFWIFFVGWVIVSVMGESFFDGIKNFIFIGIFIVNDFIFIFVILSKFLNVFKNCYSLLCSGLSCVICY